MRALAPLVLVSLVSGASPSGAFILPCSLEVPGLGSLRSLHLRGGSGAHAAWGGCACSGGGVNTALGSVTPTPGRTGCFGRALWGGGQAGGWRRAWGRDPGGNALLRWCMPLRGGGGSEPETVGEGVVVEEPPPPDGESLLQSAYDFFDVDEAVREEQEGMGRKRGMGADWGRSEPPRVFKRPREGGGGCLEWDGRRRGPGRHAVDPANEWIPIISGQDSTAAIRASRRQERRNKKLQKVGLSSVGLYSNTARVGNVTRINSRQPSYVSGRAFRPVGPSGSNFVKSNFTAIHGNFNRYYGYRQLSRKGTAPCEQISPGVREDARLDLLQEEWFAGKRCLDIGCNAGEFTMSIAYKFGCNYMLGIDCDKSLVSRARKNKQSIKWPECDKDAPEVARPQVNFKPIDFITGWNASSPDAERYDTICCFSVTKWVHLNHGDDGLMTLFKRCFDLLKEGGRFVLEPQPWRSYHRRRQVSEAAKRNFETIQIRPDNFTEALQQVGFQQVEKVGIPSGVTKGFQRPIFLCTKGS